MITSARVVLREMRGISRSHLLAADDGNCYVTKFARNSEARRRLINEWLGSQLLSRVGIATPPAAIIEASAAFLSAHESKLASISREPVSLQGFHFGSQFPGDPATTAVYDYLPDQLLARVENPDDFLKTLVVDLWCGKTSRRQAVFVRSQEHAGAFRALMIDNDDLFGGNAWAFADSTDPRLCFSLVVYSGLTGMVDLTSSLAEIRSIPAAFIEALALSVPTEWTAGDGPALRGLLERLIARQRALPSLVRSFFQSNGALFPSWVNEASIRKAPGSECPNRNARRLCVA